MITVTTSVSYLTVTPCSNLLKGLSSPLYHQLFRRHLSSRVRNIVRVLYILMLHSMVFEHKQRRLQVTTQQLGMFSALVDGFRITHRLECLLSLPGLYSYFFVSPLPSFSIFSAALIMQLWMI
ncbi:hypothetical protein BDV26DRAFT_268127 [Aspergillus bertholletiae]|uniref:Uncharacterized protein n=1 Tax=Aspergillus bertholletiae TaxID=1226010 RepID=A0A5N7AZV5_9EURO|nr:hypothetical protein BDV26DRAFT_268127 [Aspergillus bertholletiae]